MGACASKKDLSQITDEIAAMKRQQAQLQTQQTELRAQQIELRAQQTELQAQQRRQVSEMEGLVTDLQAKMTAQLTTLAEENETRHDQLLVEMSSNRGGQSYIM